MSPPATDIASTPSIVGDGCNALTGRAKRDHLFENGIRATAYDSADRPDVVGGLLGFSEAALNSIANHLLSHSLTRVSDELETPKLKLFHTYGTTAKIVFVPEPGTPYTGLFAERVPGLARFSFAGPVAAIGVVPAVALKFPIDGDAPSRNVIAMAKLDPQGPPFSGHISHNSVFEFPFTNILPSPGMLNLTMRVVNHRFETVNRTGFGLHQAVGTLGAIRANGEPVPPEQARSPYRLIFRPTERVRAASDPTIDFRDDLARNIPAGTAIYDVLAVDEAAEKALRETAVPTVADLIPHAAKIGAIVTESEFIASKYGDYRLFFKHDDSFIRPEFKQAPANSRPS
jgi:hypothetical protein